MDPSLEYLMGDPPSWTKVPKAVGVKKAGTPAPPARIRSASVPLIENNTLKNIPNRPQSFSLSYLWC